MRADAAEHHRVAVRLCIGDALGTGHATCAADVFNDDLLTEQLAHALCDDAADRVLRSTRREWNDHRQGACRKILSGGLASRNERGEGRGKQYFFHWGPLTIGIEPCAGSGRPSSVTLTDLDHLFGKLVQPIARAVTA